MPLVFVHGVSNRDNPAYRCNVYARNAFLRSHVIPKLNLDPVSVQIHNPYWGNHGVQFRWGNASLPESSEKFESFGSVHDTIDLQIAADVLAGVSEQADLVQIAVHSLTDVIDIVWSAAMPVIDTAENAFTLAESYQQAFDYATANPKPNWLTHATNDNFVDLLLYNVEQYTNSISLDKKEMWQSFGGGGQLWERLKESTSRMSSIASNAGGSVVAALARKNIHLKASLFIGDVFEYLDKRGCDTDPGPIVKEVQNCFRTASELAGPDDSKLIILGHSLGGVITYDILTYFDNSLEVDLFVTIGSQVALFEEMTLYKISRPDLPANPPTEKLSMPTNIKQWINVLDVSDPFGFRAEGVFEGVQDYEYDTGWGLFKAHSGYFSRPSFYRRLGERLAQGEL